MASIIIRSEVNDVYNRILRKPVAIALLSYAVITICSSNSQEVQESGLIAHRVRDTQALMVLRFPFSTIHLNFHAGISLFTVLLMIIQKELIYRQSLMRLVTLPKLHRSVGLCTCAMMILLAALGYSMRLAPTLRNFEAFSVAFASPWSKPKLDYA